jgi:hypothetical protein
MNSVGMLVLLLAVGLLLSLNSFSISVFSSLIAGALGKGHSKAKMHTIASTYLLAYWVLTAVLGVALVLIFSSLSAKSLQILALMVASAAILWGMLTLRHYFWSKKHSRVPLSWHGLLHTHTIKKSSPHSAMVAGLLACLISFGSIGLQLLALTVIVALLTPAVPQWMLLPALTLILPLVLLYRRVLSGYKVSTILKWKNESRAMMSLSLSLAHIALGWIILLILNGSIGVLL